MTNFSNSA